LAETLAEAGTLRLIGPERAAHGLTPGGPDAAGLSATVLRTEGTIEATLPVIGYSAEEDGTRQAIALAEASFAVDELSAAAEFDVPLELRNRIAAFGLDGAEHAG